MAYLQLFLTDQNQALHTLDQQGNAYLKINEQKPRKKIRTRKPSAVDKYLKYLEWEENKKKLPMFFTYPTMSQNFLKLKNQEMDLRKPNPEVQNHWLSKLFSIMSSMNFEDHWLTRKTQIF